MRDALHTAALALLLAPAAAQAQTATDHIDVTSLLYSEQSRTQVIEPVVRFSRLMADGQSISAQLGIDVITGASPTGELPSGVVQTRTSASGRTVTSAAGALPTAPFNDRRFSFDGEWKRPFARFYTSTLGGHFSREKDYQSLGVNGGMSIETMGRLLTLSIGGGVSHDTVFPIGGTPAGLSTGVIISHAANAKNVSNILLGASRILTRRWMVSVNGTRTMERGYLTEPYKLVTVMNSTTGSPIEALTDKRPSTRNRSSLLLSSVYHFTDDVFYTSYRYYWDTWSVRSNTIDVKYRHELDPDAGPNAGTYLEPLVRYYKQTAASFYTPGLIQGNPLPDFATSDYRLGALQTITIGATFGYHPMDSSNVWTARAEFMRQSGGSSPPNVVGIQRNYDLTPPVNIFAVVLGYSFDF
jgi:hypothetical protein